MLPPGSHRQRLARKLNDAYAEGVLSQNTLVHRLELLLRHRLVDPARLVGDLPKRRGLWPRSVERVRLAARQIAARRQPPVLLALDWEGGGRDLVIGRHPDCDIVLSSPAVSRRHAQLSFRDGAWVLRDLGSMNGTVVNRARVGRCRLRAGDRIVIGDTQLVVD
jgi:hypothetical protein